MQSSLAFRLFRRVYHALRLDKLRAWREQRHVDRVVPRVRENYARALNRLRARAARGEKLRVLFLCSESSKWKMQGVYDRLRADSRFEPLIAVSLYGWHDDLAAAERKMSETTRFFQERAMNPQPAYSASTHRAIPLSTFNPDIVFYDQPWDVMREHMPEIVSAYALTCYCSYAVTTLVMSKADCAQPFHRTLFRYFMQSDQWKDFAVELRGDLSVAGEIVTTGHPMLDLIHPEPRRPGAPRRAIYAPHWSFPHPDNPNDLDISTFLWTGRDILRYAESHPEIDWIFKPHPVLKLALQKSGAMTAEEIDAYYRAWERVGRVCEDGSYAELFNTSDVLITDCGSFLSEYAATAQPIVHLISPQAKQPINPISAKLLSTYYQVRKAEELIPALDAVALRGEDPNREARVAAARKLNLLSTSASENIVRRLESLLGAKRRIFCFWEPLDGMSAYLRLCMKTWRKFAPEYEIVLLDYSTLPAWLPAEDLDLNELKRLPYKAVQADAIRVALLARYGGVWLDVDTILTKPNNVLFSSSADKLTLIGRHIGAMSVRDRAHPILLRWLRDIRCRLEYAKRYHRRVPRLLWWFRIIRAHFFHTVMPWTYRIDFLGNAALEIALRGNDELLLSFDRLAIKALPELIVRPDLASPMAAYLEVCFDGGYTRDFLREAMSGGGIVCLHNSWTPKAVKKMSEAEFLESDFPLASLLRTLGI